MNKEYIIGNEGYNLKFKRETLLNYGMNRWGLNKSSCVGPTSELIRESAPSNYENWEEFYYSNDKQKKKDGIHITKEYLRYIGETLYVKLTEVEQK